ncbi:MAG: hypothetical protein DMG19_15870 [Acidobacteria bacterium]|nr:MAG: hypothetical protein DMG19_15870 [Acidobacteriota bacterium]
MILALKILAGFLMGAIPFAKLAMLGTGIDITKTGSKNPGFNNVLRVTKNWWRAGVALIGDISKGYVALLLLGPGEISASALWFIAIAAVVGHCWSPFLKFNGGKGVATTVGVLLFLEPRITLVCLPLYLKFGIGCDQLFLFKESVDDFIGRAIAADSHDRPRSSSDGVAS